MPNSLPLSHFHHQFLERARSVDENRAALNFFL